MKTLASERAKLVFQLLRDYVKLCFLTPRAFFNSLGVHVSSFDLCRKYFKNIVCFKGMANIQRRKLTFSLPSGLQQSLNYVANVAYFDN